MSGRCPSDADNGDLRTIGWRGGKFAADVRRARSKRRL